MFKFVNIDVIVFDKVWNFGVIMDKNLLFINYINDMCKKVILVICFIGWICKYFFNDGIKCLVNVLVMFWFDYLNSLFYGFLKY